jgi:hypothetical protein
VPVIDPMSVTEVEQTGRAITPGGAPGEAREGRSRRDGMEMPDPSASARPFEGSVRLNGRRTGLDPAHRSTAECAGPIVHGVRRHA